MRYLTTKIEGVEVEVSYYIDGENRPATMEDPAEYAELIIEEVNLNGVDIGEIIKDNYFNALIEECKND